MNEGLNINMQKYGDVLIVEDEKIVALHIKNRLEYMNYNVVGAVLFGGRSRSYGR